MLAPLDLQALLDQRVLKGQLDQLVRLVIRVPRVPQDQLEQPGHKDQPVRLVLLGIPALPALPDQLALLAQLVHKVLRVTLAQQVQQGLQAPPAHKETLVESQLTTPLIRLQRRAILVLERSSLIIQICRWPQRCTSMILTITVQTSKPS